MDHTRAALLDRLVDYNPQSKTERRPLRTMGKRELYESVRRELSRLLNSRCPFLESEREERERTVIDFGLPDFSHLVPQNQDDHLLLASQLREVIEIFEPRLENVRVKVEPHPVNARALSVTIEGVLAFETIREPVSFPMIWELLTRKVDSHGAE